MATQKALAFGKWLCKQHKVNYRFSNRDVAFAHPWDKKIHVCKNWSNNEFLSGVFHEIQHCINHRNGKYKIYHKKGITQENFKRWALPAEIYTDKMAKKLATKYKFYDYITAYGNNEFSKDFLNAIMETLW